MTPNTATAQQMQRFEELMARFLRAVQVQFLHNAHGLTASQLFILRYLDGCDHAKASDIAKVSGLSPGAVTQVCDELVKLGLIDRARSTDDRRVVHVSITQAGRERFEHCRRARAERMQHVLEQLGETDASEFVRILERVVEIVESEWSVKR